MPLFARSSTSPTPPEPTPEPRSVQLPGAPLVGESGLRDADSHRDFLLDSVASLQPFGIGLQEAAGLTLCESIDADLSLPIYTAATTDGWAVRTANLVGASERMPIVMPVVEEVLQASHRGAPLSGGTAVRVAAGAPIPEGADAVMPLEVGLTSGGLVQFVIEAVLHQYLRLAGSRVSEGERLVEAGVELTPRILAQIAELGNDKVLARPRPRVVVLTAADDLVEPGLPLTRLSQSYDPGTTLLATALRSDGAQVFTTGPVPTSPEVLGVTLAEQLVRADLVLLHANLTPELIDLLAEQGQIDVAQVDLMTERQGFAMIGPDRTPVLVVPRSPVQAYLTYLFFGQPLVRRLAGQPEQWPQAQQGKLASDVAADPVRPQLMLARHSEGLLSPLAMTDDGAAELARATAVMLIPAGRDPLPATAPVQYWTLP